LRLKSRGARRAGTLVALIGGLMLALSDFSRKRWFLALSASIALALGPARPARAEAPSPEIQTQSFLSVTREAGAESCPDTFALTEHVRRVRGQRSTGATVAYQVTFEFRSGVFRASIRAGNATGARVLRDRGETCASLEQATALTLALLLDSDSSALPLDGEAAAKATLEPRRPRPAGPPRATAPIEPTPLRLTLGAGGAALVGVLNPIAPALLAEAGIGVARFRTNIGALWVPEQTLELGPGSVNETLLSGVARMCLAPWQGRGLRIDVCSGVHAGLLKVRADGYTRDGAASKGWLAVPLELALATDSLPMGVELGVSALVPLRRNDFSIDNLGVAYASWPVGMLLSMRAMGSWLL
jgi:hypothetical protein